MVWLAVDLLGKELFLAEQTKFVISPSVHSQTPCSVLDAFHTPFLGHKLPGPVEASGKARESKLEQCYTHASPTLVQGLRTVVAHIFDTHPVVSLGSLMRLCLQKHKNFKN